MKKRQEEIDILAINGDKAILGECKWRNELVSVDIIKGLIEKGDIFTQFKQKYYFFFSKSGFDEKAKEMERGNSAIKLFNFDEMIVQ